MDTLVLALSIGGTASILAGAFALGLRHGIDWDHIAAITDITSTTAGAGGPDETWLTDEPGVMLTDESDHVAAALSRQRPISGGSGALAPMPAISHAASAVGSFLTDQRQALWLASLYALGHGTMVTALGLLALLAAEFLPSWIDPVMERVVGVTLIVLAAYLFYALFRYFRGQGEFRLRSRWMLLFAGVRNGFHWLIDRVRGDQDEHDHPHGHGIDQYGPATAYSVGLLHGIGAETGTQVLIIATAVGAGTKAMGIGALLFFVAGLLVSNSVVTVMSSAGFVSAQRRRLVYVAAGLFAAVFSLLLGLLFLLESGGILPDLGAYTSWLGGPDA